MENRITKPTEVNSKETNKLEMSSTDHNCNVGDGGRVLSIKGEKSRPVNKYNLFSKCSNLSDASLFRDPDEILGTHPKTFQQSSKLRQSAKVQPLSSCDDPELPLYNSSDNTSENGTALTASETLNSSDKENDINTSVDPPKCPVSTDLNLVVTETTSSPKTVPSPAVSKSSTLKRQTSIVKPRNALEAFSKGKLIPGGSKNPSEVAQMWKRTGMKIKSSVKFQEAGKIAKFKQALEVVKNTSLKYINSLAKDKIMEDEDPFILQHFNEKAKSKKTLLNTNKGGAEDNGTFVVDPAGDLFFITQGLVTLAMLYNLVSCIFRMIFTDFEESNAVLVFSLDLVCDGIYLLDFLMRFRTGYLDDGILVTDLSKIKKQYMSSSTFSLDLVAILPLCVTYGIVVEIYQSLTVLLLNRTANEASMIRNILLGEPVLRLLKLAKFYVMRKFFDTFGSRTNSPGVMRALCLVIYLLLSIHWVACIYYSVSQYHGFGVDAWVFPKFEEGDPNNEMHRKYIRCFYWAFLTLTTIGGPEHPETTLQYILTCITFLLGIFIFAAVVGNVGDAITSMNESKTSYQKRADSIKLYMQHHGVPEVLQRKVAKWLEYSYVRTQGSDEQDLMDALPERLRARIAIQIHVKTLKKVKIFENCEHGLLCELVLKLKPQIYSPGDYICRIGEIGKEMFILSHGKVECIITTDSGERKTVAVLVAGQSFGEIALLGVEGCSRRTADVRSIGFSELLSLSKKALTQALEDYPEARKQLEQEGKNRLGKGSSSKQTSNKKDESEEIPEPEDSEEVNAAELTALVKQLKSFDSLVYKEKVELLISQKDALQSQLEEKTKELDNARLLIKKLNMNGHARTAYSK